MEGRSARCWRGRGSPVLAASFSLLFLLAVGCSAERGREETPAEAILRGKALYQRHGCAVCHGREGRGDGPIARNFNPRPRDFREESAFKNGRSLEAIAETIENGLLEEGVGMPGYPHLANDERRAIAAYVGALRATD